MMLFSRTMALLMGTALLLTACLQNSQDEIIGSNKSQVELRSIQSKAFDTTDQTQTLRSVIATLQDLGFVIDKADLDLGTVSGSKLSGYAVRLTVSTRIIEKRTVVRASGTYFPPGGMAPRVIDDPKPYQDFFAALQKSMFLTAHDVE